MAKQLLESLQVTFFFSFTFTLSAKVQGAIQIHQAGQRYCPAFVLKTDGGIPNKNIPRVLNTGWGTRSDTGGGISHIKHRRGVYPDGSISQPQALPTLFLKPRRHHIDTREVAPCHVHHAGLTFVSLLGIEIARGMRLVGSADSPSIIRCNPQALIKHGNLTTSFQSQKIKI